jgi:pimeloyl-ACP methyl ester carboxylesterase
MHRQNTGPEDLGRSSSILFLHGSLSSGRMWAPYAELFGSFTGLAPDLIGYGAGPHWPADKPLTLTDEVQAVLSGVGDRAAGFDVVAHSYGATVAVRLAILAPHRVRSLCLVEPVGFYLLPHLGPEGRLASREIRDLAQAIGRDVARGEPAAAVGRFVDYWSGAGTWAAMPASRQQSLTLRAAKIVRDFEAIAAEWLSPVDFRKLAVPALVITGDRGPRPPVLAGECMARMMPRASGATISGAGHMLPLTHKPELASILVQWLTPAAGGVPQAA